MNTMRLFLMKPASAPFAFVILILLCIACACPRLGEKSDQRISNTTVSKTKTPSNPTNKNNSRIEKDETVSSNDEDKVTDNYSETENSSDSSSSYFIGTWKVTQANAYMPEYKPLTINRDGTYSWEEPVSTETFTGNWRMEDGLLIIEKAYKGADWSVKVFKPGNQTTTSDQIWMNCIGDGMGFYEYKGFRP
ncbi:MAG TPA: hypothetical protein PKE69_11405 [Pyrinomonadaceae bacterium]|nr:hypothetical protein [Pyrinomonadaceae bacterium]